MPPTAAQIVREAKLFTFYARNIWPLHRLVVRKHLASRCRNCMASEHFTSLDEHGWCPACRDRKNSATDPPGTDMEEDLNNVLWAHQGRGHRFDALVLFSGGKDSTYMIHRIQQICPGLRILALTMDNTFMSPVARRNVDELVPKLGVAHMWYRPAESFMVKLFRYGLTHLNEAGCYGTVDFSDGEFTLDTARNTAEALDIPLILCGYSRYQVEDGLKLSSFESPAEREQQARENVAGIPLDNIFEKDEQAAWWQGAKCGCAPRLLFPLYAWSSSENSVLRYVRERGLLPDTARHPMVTNHQLIPLLGAVDVHRRGYTSFEPEFCRMVRDGKMDKEAWRPVFEMAEYASKTGAFVRRSVVEGLRRLNLRPEDVGLPAIYQL